MTITTGAYTIRQQHSIHPWMNDPISRPQRNPTSIHNKIRKIMLSFYINWLWISCSVAKRLHNKISWKAQTGKLLKFISCHWPSCILRTNSPHSRFTVCAWSNSFNPTSFTNHFLSKRIPSITFIFWNWSSKNIRCF